MGRTDRWIRVISLAAFLAMAWTASAQTPAVDYFGQTPPGDKAVVFAPGEISKPFRGEHGAVYSRDGKEFYFSATLDWVNLATYVRRRDEKGWTAEQKASFSLRRNAAEPALSDENNSLVFTDGFDFWIVKREGADWGEAEMLPSEINSKPYQWHPSPARNGNLYFSYKGDIYKSELKNGKYRTAGLLPEPVNSSNWDADAVIAPDESWILFNSNRSGGFGDADIWISYAKPGGGWTEPVNLGPNVNSAKMDDPSSITPDGKNLLFSRRTESESDIYWVSAGFIGRFKPKDAAP